MKFREFPACFHAFDIIGLGAPISDEALAFTFDTFATFRDTFVDT